MEQKTSPSRKRYLQNEATRLRIALCDIFDNDREPYNIEYFHESIQENMRSRYAASRQYLKEELLSVLDTGAYRGTHISLTGLAPNHYHGWVVVLLYLADIPLAVYRSELAQAWSHDHRMVIRAAQNRHRLRAMFRKAQYPLPAEWPATIRIWRGTSHLSKEKAVRGISWTIDRDEACWFAMRFAKTNGNPLVLAADVPKASVLLYDNCRGEHEVICFDVSSATIDGDIEDWTRQFEIVRQDNVKLAAQQMKC